MGRPNNDQEKKVAFLDSHPFVRSPTMQQQHKEKLSVCGPSPVLIPAAATLTALQSVMNAKVSQTPRETPQLQEA